MIVIWISSRFLIEMRTSSDALQTYWPLNYQKEWDYLDTSPVLVYSALLFSFNTFLSFVNLNFLLLRLINLTFVINQAMYVVQREEF